VFSEAIAAWIAIGAAIAAALSLLLAYLFLRSLRRIRRAQTVVIGSGRDDLVEFAVNLQTRLDELHRAVDEVAAGLVRVDRRFDDSISRAAVVRFDAFEDLGGQQSTAVALLDSARSGIVISTIQGRDHARLYVKELDRGHTTLALSPEEQRAVERAMAHR
jgi:HAMP domain-containing protein